MITEKGTAVGDKGSATDMLMTDDVVVCIRHNQIYARDLHQALPFAGNVDNG